VQRAISQSRRRGSKQNRKADAAKINALAREVEQRLTSIRQHLRKPLEAEFARGHLTGPQRTVMHAVVTAREPLRLREITNGVGLAQSTVSGIVERLVEKGMLVRMDDPEDARASRIAASALVKDFLEKQMPKLTLSPLVAALRACGLQDAERIVAAVARLDELLAGKRA